MSKPSWDDAPEWANWLAMDEDGDWYWHKKEPYFNGVEWLSDFGVTYAGNQKTAPYSLEKRP